jgi:hypothetical protein
MKAPKTGVAANSIELRVNAHHDKLLAAAKSQARKLGTRRASRLVAELVEVFDGIMARWEA